ncbi:MAG: hypothetical protein R2698_07335 [Microthrixaceae bacterium]
MVHTKDETTFAGVLGRHGIDPARFVYVGNSLRSDVWPVLRLGGAAVHVPYHTTWLLEQADPPVAEPRFRHCERLEDVPSCVEELLVQMTTRPTRR